MSHKPPDQQDEPAFLDNSPSILPEKSITVLVVDDHALVRAAIIQALSSRSDITCLSEAQDYIKAEEQAATLHPDIIVLDMHIQRSDTIAAIGRLRKLSPDSRILALADVENEQEAFAAVMAGAQGYRSKQDIEPGDIMTMIQLLCRGELVLRPALVTRLVELLRTAALPLWGTERGAGNRPGRSNTEYDWLVELTTREREVLQLISQGYRDRDIAEGLHISEKTVQKHVQGILSKLGVQNRTEAAYVVHRQSLL